MRPLTDQQKALLAGVAQDAVTKKDTEAVLKWLLLTDDEMVTMLAARKVEVAASIESKRDGHLAEARALNEKLEELLP